MKLMDFIRLLSEILFSKEFYVLIEVMTLNKHQIYSN
jgi:hypothetical protein